MVAKPVIAIMMEVPFGKMPQTMEELPVLECRHKGDGGIPGREVYEYLPPYIDLPVNHFYTCYPDHDQLEGHRAFGDFLTANQEWREKLSALKLALDRTCDSSSADSNSQTLHTSAPCRVSGVDSASPSIVLMRPESMSKCAQ